MKTFSRGAGFGISHFCIRRRTGTVSGCALMAPKGEDRGRRFDNKLSHVRRRAMGVHQNKTNMNRQRSDGPRPEWRARWPIRCMSWMMRTRRGSRSWQKIFRSHRDMRGGAFICDTLSAIDMALWDITGKLYGVPVYRLLGGRWTKIRCIHAESDSWGRRAAFSHAAGSAESREDGWDARRNSGRGRGDVRLPLRDTAADDAAVCRGDQAL